jgi:hypothetical protein
MHALTITQLDRLADLRSAALDNSRVSWAVDGDTDRIVEGVARHFTDVNGNFPAYDEDVRNMYFRVSGTVEHFLPVRDVLTLMHDGLFFVHTTH